MKHFIITVEIILLCLICTASAMICKVSAEELDNIQSEIKIKKQPSKEEEYIGAAYIWSYLTELGYSNWVTAGIIGNIMVEVGGGTLELLPLSETKEYYGMCQWKREYFPEVIGMSLEEQCNFLKDTIEYEINTFYPKYSYENFLAIEDTREAALVFARGYERCSKGTYKLRQDCAEIAYEYFS